MIHTIKNDVKPFWSDSHCWTLVHLKSLVLRMLLLLNTRLFVYIHTDVGVCHKKQEMRSRELSTDLPYQILWSHRCLEEYLNIFPAHSDPKSPLYYRHSEIEEVNFVDLAATPNWVMGDWIRLREATNKLVVTLNEIQRWEKIKGQSFVQHSTRWNLTAKWTEISRPSHSSLLRVSQKIPELISDSGLM